MLPDSSLDDMSVYIVIFVLFFYEHELTLFCHCPSFIRSPWSNKYDPPIEDGAMPSGRLRKLEVEANNAFDQYRDL